MKLTKEDIKKYGTEDEKKILEVRRWRTSPPEQAIVRKIERIQRLLAELSVSDEMVEMSISTPDSVYRDLEKAQKALAKFASNWHMYPQ